MSRLILIVGVAGSGKSTLTKSLSRMILNSVHISKDFVQDRLAGQGIERSDVRIATYQFLLDFCDEQLSSGKIVIIDAPFSKTHRINDGFQDWPARFSAIAAKNKSTLNIIRCKAPSKLELRKRLESRNLDRDKEKIADWKTWTAFEPENFPINHEHTDIITDRNPEELCNLIIATLDTELLAQGQLKICRSHQ